MAGDTGVAAFLLLKFHIGRIFPVRTGKSKKTASKDHVESLGWIFCVDITDGSNGARFEDCCAVLQCEGWVVRMRIQLEFWNRHVCFDAPLTGFVLPPPSPIVNMAYACAGDFGIWVCRKLLEWPGMMVEPLLEMNGAPPEWVLPETIQKLERKGIIASRFDGRFLYCVGRSPIRPDGLPDRRPWINLWTQ